MASPVPVIERLLDHDVVHEHLGDAAKRLREAIDDIARAVRRVEEPPPKPHRMRTLILALLAGAAAAAATNRFTS
jgi:hypothetical protein